MKKLTLDFVDRVKLTGGGYCKINGSATRLAFHGGIYTGQV
jgi:hypothetical protein